MKKNVAIIYGGFSGERVISERSAKVVEKHLENSTFQPYLVDIGKSEWTCKVGQESHPIDKNNFAVQMNGHVIQFEAVFCAIHGTPGEDGKIQGYFDTLNIPYNNCGVLASAITFNKAACNRYLKASGVKVAESYIARIGHKIHPEKIVERVGLPCFVKPNDGGSSIGVSKVKSADQLEKAILNAQQEGVDALIESLLVGTEVSCGCISENGKPTSIGVTEIIPANEFFDFESKYTDDGTKEITPARIDASIYESVSNLTESIYEWLHCKGMIRVDYMICDDGIYLIEVNTTPGLSEASIVPQQALHSGYSLQRFFEISIEESLRTI